MSTTEARERFNEFARRTVDVHLPVLAGLMAEDGQQLDEQARRASKLVDLLRSAEIASSITSGGRPIPLKVEKADGAPRLQINGKMLSKVDDGALASAMADTVAELLDVAPVATSLVLQTTDERQMRGLAGQLGMAGGPEVVSMTQVRKLVHWRLEIFEDRLYALCDGLGGWLEAPVVDRDRFVDHIGTLSKRWPEWRDVSDQSYITTWIDELDSELDRTGWGDSTEAVAEMMWDSVAISARSALRQAAQSLRSLSTGGDAQELLEVIADLMGGDQAVDGSLDNWPNFHEVLHAWEDLWREEDDVIGARRRIARVPEISVFEAPGSAMGFSEPKNLPWELPLLCWTKRERDGLRDLVEGMETSLARNRRQVRAGRLSRDAYREVAPPVEAAGDSTRWNLHVPTKLPDIDDGFTEAIDTAFASIRACYEVSFSNLDRQGKKKALKLSRGAYGGYLQSAKAIWKRRLAGTRSAPPDEGFRMMMTGLAEALEWPIFVDVFEDGVNLPPVASMPRFTLPAVWCEDAEFAPIWLPVEAIGESLEQAPLRIRNVAVTDSGDRVEWLGDYRIETRDLQELSAGNLLKSVHEGALLLTVTRR